MKGLPVVLLALVLGACASQEQQRAPELTAVTADLETVPVASDGDAADDPAIWLHPDEPARSLVITTDKQRGINVYDLAGQLVQTLTDGAINNVDLRYGFRAIDGRRFDVVAGSNRTDDTIALYAIDRESGRLQSIGGGDLRSELTALYGLCMGFRQADEAYFVYATSRDGAVEQFRLLARDDGLVGLRRVGRFALDSQVEACVVDDRSGRLYVAEETRGIWSVPAWGGDPSTRRLIARVGENGLTADVEGLAILHLPLEGYLVASSQGSNSYNVYELYPPYGFLGAFRIADGPVTDATEETDGIAILASAMGPFNRGLMVAQDGYNRNPDARQDFKLLGWDRVARALGLSTHPDWNPRSH